MVWVFKFVSQLFGVVVFLDDLEGLGFVFLLLDHIIILCLSDDHFSTPLLMLLILILAMVILVIIVIPSIMILLVVLISLILSSIPKEYLNCSLQDLTLSKQ